MDGMGGKMRKGGYDTIDGWVFPSLRVHQWRGLIFRNGII